MGHKATRPGKAGHPLIAEVEPVILGVLKLVFDDGYEGVLDMRVRMDRPIRKGVNWSHFKNWNEFQKVQVDENGSHIFWVDPEGHQFEAPADGLRRDCERQEAIHKLMD